MGIHTKICFWTDCISCLQVVGGGVPCKLKWSRISKVAAGVWGLGASEHNMYSRLPRLCLPYHSLQQSSGQNTWRPASTTWSVGYYYYFCLLNFILRNETSSSKRIPVKNCNEIDLLAHHFLYSFDKSLMDQNGFKKLLKILNKTNCALYLFSLHWPNDLFLCRVPKRSLTTQTDQTTSEHAGCFWCNFWWITILTSLHCCIPRFLKMYRRWQLLPAITLSDLTFWCSKRQSRPTIVLNVPYWRLITIRLNNWSFYCANLLKHKSPNVNVFWK